MELSSTELSPREGYGLLTSVIVPRPIAWVSTLSKSGARNLAPFSYFMGVASDPMTIAIGIGQRPDGRPKDSFRNIEDTGAFCVNLVEEQFANPMNLSAGSFEPDVDEFEMSGLVSTPCVAIAGVRVQGTRAALECKLIGVHRYGSVNLTVGEVVHAFLDDNIVLAGRKRADPNVIQPVARLGGAAYAKLGERFSLGRPKV